MKALFNLYRVLATVVGVSIVTLIVIGVPLKYAYQWFPGFWPNFLDLGAHGQKLGADITLYLGTAHGFIYMAFVLVALIMANESRWPFPFIIVTILCGTIPFVSFWAEARAVQRIRAAHPEWSSAPPATPQLDSASTD